MLFVSLFFSLAVGIADAEIKVSLSLWLGLCDKTDPRKNTRLGLSDKTDPRKNTRLGLCDKTDTRKNTEARAM